MTKVFTTGQAAKVCQVSSATVVKWFDNGRITGYRVPGSRDRRIPRDSLIKFLRDHGIPLDGLEAVDQEEALLEEEDRFVTPADLPTPYQRELLTILAEEAAEVIKRATKALRFGLDEIQPGQSLSNRARLGNEVGDFQCVVDKLRQVTVLTTQDILDGKVHKESQLRKYMQTRREDE